MTSLAIQADPGATEPHGQNGQVAGMVAADAVLIALSHGLEGWMVGDSTDAVEIAVFADATGNRLLPRTPQAIEQLLREMVGIGLLEERSRPSSHHRWTEVYGAYGLSEAGWNRASELEYRSQPDRI